MIVDFSRILGTSDPVSRNSQFEKNVSQSRSIFPEAFPTKEKERNNCIELRTERTLIEEYSSESMWFSRVKEFNPQETNFPRY